MSASLQTLFRYQAWADAELFRALGAMDQQRHSAELHAALRLLNHAHVVAQIFAAHLSGARHPYAADNTEQTPSLAQLRDAFAASDQWFLDFLHDVSPERLAEPISFRFTDGDQGRMTREEMLTHVVLHSAYHRAEAGRMLAGRFVTPPWDTFAVFLHQSEPARRLAP